MTYNFQLKTQGLGFAFPNRTIEFVPIPSLIYLGGGGVVTGKRTLFNWLLRKRIARIFRYFHLQMFPEARNISSYAFL